MLDDIKNAFELRRNVQLLARLGIRRDGEVY
jgi:hypothetical protein